jgi:hypothetical protein
MQIRREIQLLTPVLAEDTSVHDPAPLLQVEDNKSIAVPLFLLLILWVGRRRNNSVQLLKGRQRRVHCHQ